MSQSEDDLELHELVTDALEKNGVLAAVRAHLRAGVYLALEREHEQSTSVVHQLIASRDGVFALLLVQDFLESCQLKRSASVYRAETGQPKTFAFQSRDAVVRDFKLSKVVQERDAPLLVQLISVFFALIKKVPIQINENAAKSANETLDPTNSCVGSNDSDGYARSFASDVSSDAFAEHKSRVALQLNLNRSSGSNRSRSDDDRSSERSSNDDTRIELHTDSEKSVSELENLDNFKYDERDDDSTDTLRVNSGNDVKRTISESIKNGNYENDLTASTLATVDENSETTAISSKEQTLSRKRRTNLGVEKNSDTSQCSATNYSNESIPEDIPSYGTIDDTDINETNIIDKLTASSEHSFSSTINEEINCSDLSKNSSNDRVNYYTRKKLFNSKRENKSNSVNDVSNENVERDITCNKSVECHSKVEERSTKNKIVNMNDVSVRSESRTNINTTTTEFKSVKKSDHNKNINSSSGVKLHINSPQTDLSNKINGTE